MSVKKNQETRFFVPGEIFTYTPTMHILSSPICRKSSGVRKLMLKTSRVGGVDREASSTRTRQRVFFDACTQLDPEG